MSHEVDLRHSECPLFFAWAFDVQRLCEITRLLEPTAELLKISENVSRSWRGLLFSKLEPQLTRKPVLVVAVCGGTNTGKSFVANYLAGTSMSRSVPEAARTLHPVASLPHGMSVTMPVHELFPGFVPFRWSSDSDAIQECDEHRIVWREDETGRQSQRLIILDTPDVDGPLRENWRRAELVRDSADVIVAVLTQQKYNDAAVREFFAAAGAAHKEVLIVFNMLSLPEQQETAIGWLSTFRMETGIEPLAVYMVPWNRSAADSGTLRICDASATRDILRDLSELEIDRIKIRSMKGSLALVLDESVGVPNWLEAIESQSKQWQKIRQTIANEVRVEVSLPPAPREIIWNEIWEWLEPRRSSIDLKVSKVYSSLGRKILWMGRKVGVLKSQEQKQEDFAAIELDALTKAMSDLVDRLDILRTRSTQLHGILNHAFVEVDRSDWYADLERRHKVLPLVSDDYRKFVRSELDRYAKDNPGAIDFIKHLLTAAAVARPVVTIGLFTAGAAGAAMGMGFVHHIGDILVGTATSLAGEGAIGLTASSLKPLLESLFAGWSSERARVLARTLEEVVLGDLLTEIDQRACCGSQSILNEARLLVRSLREASTHSM